MSFACQTVSLCSAQVPCPWFHLLYYFLFTAAFCPELLAHPCRSLVAFAWPSANQEGWSLSLEKVIPETQWTLLDPILSRSISYRIPPSRSLSRPKSAALQSSAVILILRCSILSGPWTPPSHSHYSEGCPQSSHPWIVLPCLSAWGQALSFSSSALWSFLSGNNDWCTL